MTKKEKAIKDINVKELNANWRTWLFIAIFASLIIGFVGGWFATISLTSQARADWITAQNASKDQ